MHQSDFQSLVKIGARISVRTEENGKRILGAESEGGANPKVTLSRRLHGNQGSGEPRLPVKGAVRMNHTDWYEYAHFQVLEGTPVTNTFASGIAGCGRDSGSAYVTCAFPWPPLASALHVRTGHSCTRDNCKSLVDPLSYLHKACLCSKLGSHCRACSCCTSQLRRSRDRRSVKQSSSFDF